MKQNVFSQVAKNNNVSEEEVKREIEQALQFAESAPWEKKASLDEIVAILAQKTLAAMEKEGK